MLPSEVEHKLDELKDKLIYHGRCINEVESINNAAPRERERKIVSNVTTSFFLNVDPTGSTNLVVDHD